MSSVEILKFGSSVLRSPQDLRIAVDEIYRRWRSGFRILAVVSAFEGVTDQLMAEVAAALGTDSPEATAAYVATGEQRTAALLLGALLQHGLPARLVDPREIGLLAEGPTLESTPTSVHRASLEALWKTHPLLILPGFYGIDAAGRIALFGRGGSDLSALFLATALNCNCRLLKDVPGVFDTDPAKSTHAHRFSTLSWERALRVAGHLIQPKALHYARERHLAFEVGRPNEAASTKVGLPRDAWATPASSRTSQLYASINSASPSPLPRARPLRIALLGCGTVGRGVYDALKHYPQSFDIRHVFVRSPGRYPDIDRLTTDAGIAIHPDIDVVIVAIASTAVAYAITATALSAGKYVVTANKSSIASHGASFAHYTRGPNRRLWYSAAVGGALPALEALAMLKAPVREIRGIINGTCGVVLDAWARGMTRHDAEKLAQAQGFAESNPIQDVSGRDSADKLALLIEAAFGEWIDPKHIPTQGIDTITDDPAGYKLIARASRAISSAAGTPHRNTTATASARAPDAAYAAPVAHPIVASVAPERPAPETFLGQARGPENRFEIEFASGAIIRLRAQGAGRWPTTVSILGDLHEIARLVQQESELAVPQPITSTA
jgi:homoserine dehydrogenase